MCGKPAYFNGEMEPTLTLAATEYLLLSKRTRQVLETDACTAWNPSNLPAGAPFKDWVLPTAMERVRRKLASVDDGNRQMVDILTAVLSDGLPAVNAACAEAIAQGVHSAAIVLNILARQRDPGPPATIFTPAALTLRHAPIADCARYDNLRRTI
jgi:hypothetical protein